MGTVKKRNNWTWTPFGHCFLLQWLSQNSIRQLSSYITIRFLRIGMQFFVNRESRVSFLTQKEMVFLTLLLMYFVGNLLCIVWINVDNIYKTCYCFISLFKWRDQHYYIIKPIFGSRNHYTWELHHYALWYWTSVLKVSSKRPDLFTQIAEALCYKRIELYMCYCLSSLLCWQQESSPLYQYTFAIGDYNWCLKKCRCRRIVQRTVRKMQSLFPFLQDVH